MSPRYSVLMVTLLSSYPKTTPSVRWCPTTFATVASIQGLVSSSVKTCKLTISCSEWANRLPSILFRFLLTSIGNKTGYEQIAISRLSNLLVASFTYRRNIHRRVQAIVQWDKCKNPEEEVGQHCKNLQQELSIAPKQFWLRTNALEVSGGGRETAILRTHTVLRTGKEWWRCILCKKKMESLKTICLCWYKSESFVWNQVCSCLSHKLWFTKTTLVSKLN